MLRHVVMFRWNDGVGDAHVAELGAGLDDLARTIPEIAAYRHGPDAGINPGNFDYVVVGDFATEQDYLTYRDHPRHRDLIERLIAPHIRERSAVQFRIDG